MEQNRYFNCLIFLHIAVASNVMTLSKVRNAETAQVD